MRKVIPSAITFAGAALGLMGVAVLGSYRALGIVLLWSSIICDVADGHLARRLGATSHFGAALDWMTDTTIFIAIAWTIFPKWVAALLIPLSIVWWAYASTMRIKFSGRSTITLIATSLIAIGAI